MRLKKFFSTQATPENRAPSPNHLSAHSLSYTAPGRPSSSQSGASPVPNRYDAYGQYGATLAFPEPQLYRTTSYQGNLNVQQQQGHYSSYSEDIRHGSGLGINANESMLSLDTTFSQDIEDNFDAPQTATHEAIAGSQLLEDGIRLFQEGRLPPQQEQWHMLVPPEAVDVLGKEEVARQSILFEIIQSERDYVSDLELVREIFIEPLLNFQPPIIEAARLQGFVQNVFNNIPEIVTFHQTMLAALFGRQRDQHPIIQGLADIVLDTALKFQSAYEPYVKHYPIAEAAHRSEMNRNPKYENFISRASEDPRTKRRDLITFISRPVTRLPRLNLLLETLKKKTPESNANERDAIDLVVSTTGTFLKSLQPGIEVANRKVEFFALVEQLVFRRGEKIDMDLYSDQRSLIFSGTLARRRRGELELRGWVDMHVTLLDNYFIQTKPEERGTHKLQMVVSRPIPLDYLRLVDAYPPPEARSERTGLLQRDTATRWFAFTVYHAASPLQQRYTLYAPSEASRDEWVAKIREVITIREVQVEANRWFASSTINRGVFAARTPITYAPNKQFTGLVTSVAAFAHNGRAMLLVACHTGLFVGLRADSNSFRQVTNTPNIVAIAAADKYNKAFVLADGSLCAYSLDLIVRVASGHAPRQSLNASMEKLTRGTVRFFRLGVVLDKCIVAFCFKSLLDTNLACLEVISPSESYNPMKPRSPPSPTPSFREFGSTIYIPRDAYDVTFLSKSMAIANERGITIINPLNPSSVLTVPDFNVPKDDKTKPAYLTAVSDLRPKCDVARALGIVPVGDSDLLIIYTEFGVWITKHGFPSPARDGRFVRWEITAGAYILRDSHVLLFSCVQSPQGAAIPGEFIEVRHVPTGQLRQVISARDVRLVQNGTRTAQGPVLIAMRDPDSTNDRENGTQDVLAELTATVPIVPHTPPANVPHMWSEWN